MSTKQAANVIVTKNVSRNAGSAKKNAQSSGEAGGTNSSSQFPQLDALLDDLSQAPVVDQPIEITPQVQEKMTNLTQQFLQIKEKLVKVNAVKKELTVQGQVCLQELQTLMKLYGLTELVKGESRFVLDQVIKKKPIKKETFKEVIQLVLNDPEKVEEIYETADNYSEEITIEKLKCLKFKNKI
jgi:hypothetical protein